MVIDDTMLPINALSGTDKLEGAMHRKRVWWAASIYGRPPPTIHPIAGKVLREKPGPEVDLELRWVYVSARELEEWWVRR